MVLIVKITPEEAFLVKAHALFECCVKIGELEEKNHPLLLENKHLIYGQTASMVQMSGGVVFKGQGMILSAFYMFLILPLEWQKRKIGQFEKFDFSGPKKLAHDTALITENTYETEKKNYDVKDYALTHFRNALSHGRIGWSANETLVIEDQPPDGSAEYIAEYSMPSIGELAQSLNMSIAHYIETVIKQRPKEP